MCPKYGFAYRFSQTLQFSRKYILIFRKLHISRFLRIYNFLDMFFLNVVSQMSINNRTFLFSSRHSFLSFIAHIEKTAFYLKPEYHCYYMDILICIFVHKIWCERSFFLRIVGQCDSNSTLVVYHLLKICHSLDFKNAEHSDFRNFKTFFLLQLFGSRKNGDKERMQQSLQKQNL